MLKYKAGDEVFYYGDMSSQYAFPGVKVIEVAEENELFKNYIYKIDGVWYKEQDIGLYRTREEIEGTKKNPPHHVDQSTPAHIIEGVSKDEPTTVNPFGGKQSRVMYDYTLCDPKAMFEMTKVLKYGADKYGAENWRLIPIREHLNHMLIHTYAYLAGDTSDEHLSHIMCRALFAQGVAVQTQQDVERAEKEEK